MLQRFRNKSGTIRISCNYTCWVLSYVFWYIERKYKRKNCSNDDSTFDVSNRPSINFAHYCVWSTKIDITQQKVNTKCFKYIQLDTIHSKFSKRILFILLKFWRNADCQKLLRLSQNTFFTATTSIWRRRQRNFISNIVTLGRVYSKFLTYTHTKIFPFLRITPPNE